MPNKVGKKPKDAKLEISCLWTLLSAQLDTLITEKLRLSRL
jgi:hypothetical protein